VAQQYTASGTAVHRWWHCNTLLKKLLTLAGSRTPERHSTSLSFVHTAEINSNREKYQRSQENFMLYMGILYISLSLYICIRSKYKALMERDRLAGLVVDGRMILK
jgi:hypothetical protein